ncbi:hypothetical protein NsoK4_03105 [Nitrosopumilus sp. K4]|uniref:archaellin/type IV pilin N-terminal domain-containing protein n=1 Tax=Nitrosopumilus sp. K4 TaxID=2795383 RepID=UPI001BA6CCAF|nr:archaellin/type IV pilin N-terminal domain-containing protein [Nitrosopumilus sp. K4]QUC65256.1 hypothetical protein NsoK4_03105 [Nitrosopumilus sp. K4]
MKKNSFKKSNNSKLFGSKRRGITDIIGTMMLMAVTVTGAATLTYFVNDVFVTGNIATASTLDSSTKSFQLMAYDTRDSSTLLTISNLDNNFDGKLCGVSCSGTNDLPLSGGSEFIVLKIKNKSFESVFLEDIKINNVEHEWDAKTAGITLNTMTPDFNDSDGRNYPADGKFSIIDENPIPLQSTSNEIPTGETVNILIKFGADDQDLLLSKGMQLSLNVGTMTPTEFLLESGEVR